LRWLYHALGSLNLQEMNKAAAVPGLNRDDAYEKKITFPPISEQKRIASLLDKADHLRRSRRYAKQLSDTFLSSTFLLTFRVRMAQGSNCFTLVGGLGAE
jgi:type I restriction enzyme, S subunit